MSKSNRSGKAACLSKNELEQFLSNLPEKYSLLAETMYFSAGRVGEISSIKVRNLNRYDSSITLEKSSTKTKESRSVPLPKRLMEQLILWVTSHSLASDDYVFFTSSRNTSCTIGSKKLSNQSVDEYFRKSFDWIGVPGASTHSFRRSRLTHLMNRNWNVREIMDISGHSTLESLQQYLESDKAVTFNKYRTLIEEEVI